jgi:hypothetical protein
VFCIVLVAGCQAEMGFQEGRGESVAAHDGDGGVFRECTVLYTYIVIGIIEVNKIPTRHDGSYSNLMLSWLHHPVAKQDGGLSCQFMF